MATKNEIITALYESREFNECIGKMEPDHLQDDLRSEVMLILLETPEEKIKQLHERNELKFYTVRVILNLIQSKSSPFYKKFRQPYAELNPNVNYDAIRRGAIAHLQRHKAD